MFTIIWILIIRIILLVDKFLWLNKNNGPNYISLNSSYYFILTLYKTKVITLNFFLKKDKVLAKVAMFLCAPVFILLYLYDDILKN